MEEDEQDCNDLVSWNGWNCCGWRISIKLSLRRAKLSLIDVDYDDEDNDKDIVLRSAPSRTLSLCIFLFLLEDCLRFRDVRQQLRMSVFTGGRQMHNKDCMRF